MSAASAPLTSSAAAPGPLVQSRFRPDIQGLRAVAVLLVVLNHVGIEWLSGGYVGVDVFFVISGFVITGSLLGAENRGGVSLVTFYSARARRILPMASLVLVVTLVAAWFALNFVRARAVTIDAVWAGLFSANLHFWAQGTDYFSTGLPPSPLQHYWSLSVEEQFYLVWPLLFGALAFGLPSLRRRRTVPVAIATRRVGASLAVIISVSLLLSVMQTSGDPSAAYFSPFSRAWELAVGALIAVGASTVMRLDDRVRATLTWLGIAGIAISAVILSADTPFPGLAALLPVASTAAVIAGGTGGPRAGASVLLNARPLRTIGDWSYSVYLWHWPLLLIVGAYFERDLPVWAGLGLAVVAVALSGVTYRLVEEPFRHGQWLKATRSRSLVLWPATVGVVAVASLVTAISLPGGTSSVAAGVASRASFAEEGASGEAIERAVQGAVEEATAGGPIPGDLDPSVDKIAKDWSNVITADCATGSASPINPHVCRYGDVSAKRSIVVIGDSHASMWMPALDLIGKEHRWSIVPLVKYSCALSDKVLYVQRKGPNEQCLQWSQWALEEVAQLRPDRVLVASYGHYPFADDHGKAITDASQMNGLWRDATRWAAQELKATGAHVTYIKDVPALAEQPTDCLLRRAATMATCTFPLNEAQERRNLATQEGAVEAGVSFADMDRWFCAAGLCPTVVGSTVTHWDNNHVTRTYVLSLREALAVKLGLAD